MTLSLPIRTCASMRARVKHDESTLANVLMDAITATQDDLPDLVAKVRKQFRTDGLFVRKEAKDVEERSTVTFNMRVQNVRALDNLAEQLAAESRSQMCRAALDAYLADPDESKET